MAPNTSPRHPGDVYHRVPLKSLPSFSQLQSQVQAVVRQSSWWQLYGVDWAHIAAAVLAAVPLGLWCLSQESWMLHVFGVFLLGCYHSILSNKVGHNLTHGSLSNSAAVNEFMLQTCVNFVGGFSSKCAMSTHIKYHHPHTNIIGMGDSSTWRVPYLSRIPYLFLAPLTFPVLTPLVALQQLVSDRDWRELVFWFTLTIAGVIFHAWLLIHFCGFAVLQSLVYLYIYRAMLAIQFIHINVFQHIGLPMFAPKSRPARMYQMSQGCLNLESNVFLNATFGHSLISCHVEHHLFPRLSDNMCLRVRPLVRRYLLDNGLEYHEQSYWSRLRLFLADYDRLMVDAPPISHFVGLQ